MKTIRTIFAYLLLLMFLIPATGFYYTMHSCLKSGEAQLVLNGNYACCAETSPITHNPVSSEGSCCSKDLPEPESTCCKTESSIQENSCMECSLEESSSSCCLYEGHYLKSQDEYTSPDKVELPDIPNFITAALYSVDLFPIVQETIEENSHSPPFTISSIDILHKHSVLLI